MKKKLLFIILMNSLWFSPSFGQGMDLFIPAGYTNPFLQSGQYIAGLYYQNHTSYHTLAEEETRNREYYFGALGYLGLTDDITLKAIVDIFPEQMSNEKIAGGFGGDKDKFYVAPQFILSYRMTKSLEIYGDILYQKMSIEHGPRSYYGDVPVGTDEFGNIIYEKRQIVQPGYGESKIKAINYRIGITYNGRLW